MSKTHLFHSPNGLVTKSLRGLLSSFPSLRLDEAHRVVFNPDHPPTQVSLVSGGGSGHEPAWAGYVGENMLAAAVCGDIFASPSTRQILAAIEAVPSEAGTILVVTNYTGDCLHFGLANEKANSNNTGKKDSRGQCRMIICGDDVSVGRQGRGGKDNLVGRRGLAGQIGVLKIMGGAAGQGASLDQVYNLGLAVSQQIVSIAATLDHCHVPGRTLEPDHQHKNGSNGNVNGNGNNSSSSIEIGTGPHNEPGYTKISPAPSTADLITQMLAYCLDENDPERGYVHFEPGDETLLLLSNYGGMSPLEMGALTDEILIHLARDWQIEPVRVYVGPLETSLNAPAFSMSVVNISAAARNESCGYSVEEIKAFADVKTGTCWEAVSGAQAGSRRRHKRADQLVSIRSSVDAKKIANQNKDLKVDPAVLDRMLRTACHALVDAEPELTRSDTLMGDGDCGDTLKTGATSLLAALDKSIATTGSVVTVLMELEDIVEMKMGGTLGGILSIFFVALRQAVEDNLSGNGQSKSKSDSTTSTVEIWTRSLSSAVQQLSKYTPAKVGDRTVMDALIPFVEAMQESGSFEDGVDAAIRGANSTRWMTPRLGRATYVAAGQQNGDENGHGTRFELPPDPGALGAMVVIQGLRHGMLSN